MEKKIIITFLLAFQILLFGACTHECFEQNHNADSLRARLWRTYDPVDDDPINVCGHLTHTLADRLDRSPLIWDNFEVIGTITYTLGNDMSHTIQWLHDSNQTWNPPYSTDYKSYRHEEQYTCLNCSHTRCPPDADRDISFRIKLDSESQSKLKKYTGFEITQMQCEAVAYAHDTSDVTGAGSPTFPGWRDSNWSILFNGKPFWDKTKSIEVNFDSAKKKCGSLTFGQTVKIKGALVCDEYNHAPLDSIQNPDPYSYKKQWEIHPIYSVEILNLK
jgi:hypothetical protein